jgi:hypothetical protein
VPSAADTALLERHLPLLRYDSQGSFFADSVRTLTDRVSADGKEANCLKRGDGKLLASAKPKRSQKQLTIDFLGGRQYEDQTKVARDDFLDAVGRDYVLAARELHGRAEYANRIYGHVVREEGGSIWLQYWFFYYWNNKAFLGVGLHEGDWEMVQVRLDSRERPQAVTFAQHEHGERCPWSRVEKHDGRRLVVYVARGSQASYPRPGRHRAPIASDQADGKGAAITPGLEVIDDRLPRWVAWPGRWGSTRASSILESNSPPGPKQHEQWAKPSEFNDDAIERRELEGFVIGQPELRAAPRPRLKTRRIRNRALVGYQFPRPRRGEAPATQIVVSLDSPDDLLPPATYSFPVEDSQGELEHPLALQDKRYVVRASGSTREAVPSDTVEVRLPR